MEREAEHKKIRTTKHFIAVNNSDSNDYGTASHNPGRMNISFNNTNMTNIQSYNDATNTYLNPLSLTIDLFYDNVANSFFNNKFRISSITDDARPAFALNGVSEAVSPITITIPDNVYKIGTELATAITSQLNLVSNPIGWINPYITNVPHTGSSAFIGAYVQSATTALANNSILITTISAALRSTTAGGGLFTATVYRADTNALIATSSQSATTNITQQITFTFPAGTVLPTNATGIYFRFTFDNGVIGDHSYGTAGGNLSMAASIQTNINTFDIDFDANTSSLNLAYNTAAPASLIAVNPILVLNTIFTLNGFNYDSSRIFGTTGSIIGGIYVSGSFQLPYANRVAGLLLPNYVDLQTLATIRVHSNVAKRFFTKIGNLNNPPQTRPLSLTDILFEIPTNALLGQVLTFEPNDNRFYQEINSNFDELRITITDNKNNLVNFKPNSEINFLFSIEREINVPTNEERIKSLAEYNKFKSY
jgi:hypothetical protein